MSPRFDTVHTEEAFDGFLEAAWLSEDARHGTDAGDADDSEGLPLSSNPPSPATPLPSRFDSDLPNPDVDRLFLPPPSFEVKDESDYSGDEITAFLLSDDVDATEHIPAASGSKHPEATSAASVPVGEREKMRKKVARNKRKARKRREEAESKGVLDAGAFAPKAASIKKHAAFKKSRAAHYDAKDLSVAQGAWVGTRMPRGRKTPHTIADLRRNQFKFIPWTGE